MPRKSLNITPLPLRGRALEKWAVEYVWDLFDYGDVDFQPTETLDVPPKLAEAWALKLIEDGADQKKVEEELDHLYPLVNWLNWYSDFPAGIQVPAWGWSYWLHSWIPRKIAEPEFEDDAYLRIMLDRVKDFLAFLHEHGAFEKFKTLEGAHRRMTKGPGPSLKKIPPPPPKPHDITCYTFRAGATINAFHYDLVLLVVAFAEFNEDLNKLIKFLKRKNAPVESREAKLEWALDLKKNMDAGLLDRMMIQQREISGREVGSMCDGFYDKKMPPIAMRVLREKRAFAEDGQGQQ